MKRKRAQTQKLTANTGAPSELPTFLEHVYELRRRLFWVVAVILVASAAAYPFLDAILAVLTAPLAGQQLYYLTPIGGFSFSIKICFYVGIIAAVPFIMYHLYRYIEPLMGQALRRSAMFYVGLSTLMATIGVLFAYFVSLPSALHFLTGMDLKNIQAMLTVDSYLTFVMTYLLGAALLFQIPLLLGITNNMTPLQPKKLMGAQRFVIVAAFILAAIISPTPDIMNQVLLALPVIVMYQIGVALVWFQNRGRARRAKKEVTLPAFDFADVPIPAAEPASPVAAQPVLDTRTPQTVVKQPAVVVRPQQRRVSMDGFGPALPRQAAVKPVGQPIKAQPAPLRTSTPVRQTQIIRPVRQAAPRSIQVPARSVDGFMMHRPTQIASSS